MLSKHCLTQAVHCLGYKVMQNSCIASGLAGELSLGTNLVEMGSAVLYTTALDKITMPSFRSHCILAFAILLNTLKFKLDYL